MRLSLLAIVLLGCGGTSSSSGSLVVTGNGTIGTSEGSVTASAAEKYALSDEKLPTALTYTFSGGGRVVTADANAVFAALNGARLDMLTGDELSTNEVFSGSGVLSGGVSPQNLSFAYTVQTYAKSAQPFLVLAASASNSGDTVFATLSFSSE